MNIDQDDAFEAAYNRIFRGQHVDTMQISRCEQVWFAALEYARGLQSRDREDAARYRYLIAKLQQAYDSRCFESECLSIYCHMSSQLRGDRTIQAEITWRDITDEPIGLSEAIDHARRIES